MRTAILVRCRPRWWVMPYLNTLVFLCTLFRTYPNWDRFSYWIGRGIVVEIWIGDRWRRV